jgi:hypothetical protein
MSSATIPIAVREFRATLALRAGLRMIKTGKPGLRYWPGVRVQSLAHDVNVEAGVAAAWVISGPWEYNCLYQLGRRGWQSHGAGSRSTEHSLSGRPTAASAGIAALLTSTGSSASIIQVSSREAEGVRPSDTGWVTCETFRVATEIKHVQVGDRRNTVPKHGYIMVVWRSQSSHMASSRPPIWCLDENGTVLTRLAPGEYVDSATIA